MEDAYGESALKYRPALPRLRKQRLLDVRHVAIGFAAASVLAVGVYGIAWARWHHSGVVPGYVRSSVNFPVFQPRNLPAGFAVDTSSFKLNSEVVTFVAKSAQGAVLITEQAIPRQLDFDTFYADQLSDTRRMTTGIGEATIGYFGDTELGSIVTDRTWILVRAKQGVSSQQMDAIVQSLSN